MLDFTADLAPGASLLVHCIAGISRSTAATISILVARGMPWRAAWDAVAAVRPCMMPNARIIRLIDDHHELGGELVAHLQAWWAAWDVRERPINTQAGSVIIGQHATAVDPLLDANLS